MNFSEFFILKPRFSGVVAVLMILAGLISLVVLPVSQYPNITPPQIIVTANYPGASASVLVDMVAVPIENEINGVDGVLYMSSTSSDNGEYKLTVTFDIGTDPDMAQVKVENRLQQVTALLPEVVTQEGLSVETQSANILAFLVLESPKKTYDGLFLSNFAYTNLQNPLARVQGVGSVNIYGPQYSMRVWLDPVKMAALGLSSNDVVQSVKSQNIQAAVGSIGSAPADKGADRVLNLTAKGLLNEVADFQEIIVATGPNGGLVRLKDIALVELGADNYQVSASYNNAPSVIIALSQAPNSNALTTMKNIKAQMEKLKKTFPKDMDFQIAYDSTLFVKASILNIISTLLITFGLVVLVVYLFLQDIRATLIPVITIPVSLIATFAVIYVLGFNINILTLFALILAIGLVVDDAIIVVERVQYLMQYEKMNSLSAAVQAMRDIGSSIIATTFVLLSIFIPVGLMAGLTGEIYKQFALTIATAVTFSAVNALTLSPALCALFFRQRQEKEQEEKEKKDEKKDEKKEPFVLEKAKESFFNGFNQTVEKLKNIYLFLAKYLCVHQKKMLLILFAAVAAIVSLFFIVPSSFIPQEDEGVLFANLQLPENAGINRTKKLLKQLGEGILRQSGVQYYMSIAGASLLGGSGENIGMAVIGLKPWSERQTQELSLSAISKKLRLKFGKNPDAEVNFFALPSIPGVGNSDGLSFQLNALNTGASQSELGQALEKLLQGMNDNPLFLYGFSTFDAGSAHLELQVDRTKLESFLIPVSNFFETLQNNLGSRYVNNIPLKGQVNKVIVQAAAAYRSDEQEVLNLYVPSSEGNLAQVRDFADFKTVMRPQSIDRFNQYLTASVTAQSAPSVSTGEAIKEVQKLVDSLGAQYEIAWTGLSLQEVETQGLVFILIALAFLFGYLFLVALYESWLIAFAVIFTNIFAILGALSGLKLMNLPLSIYAQLGMVLLIGLASKNAILMVQFIKSYKEKGEGILSACLKGGGERFRAVVMTALTFILGVMPMIFASGAGAASQISMGTSVFFGMIAATCVGILFVPSLFSLFDTIAVKFWPSRPMPKIILRDKTSENIFFKENTNTPFGKKKTTDEKGKVSFVFLSFLLFFAGVVLTIFLQACSVGPDYERPMFFSDAELAKALDFPAYPDGNKNNSMAKKEQGTLWTPLDFQDPVLNELLFVSFENSPTLRQAIARLLQGRANMDIATAAFFPQIDASGKYNFVKESKNMQYLVKQDYYQLGLDASWEIDIFGGTRRRKEAAKANLKSALYSLKSAGVSLMAEVALTYVRLRTTEEQIARLKENLAYQEQIYRLTVDKYETGLTNRIDVAQAAYLVKNTKAVLPSLYYQQEALKNSLALLAGKLPKQLESVLNKKTVNLINRPFEYDLQKLYDLPLSVVRNRPDVRAAEEALIAQNAAVGAAIADMFPKISVSGLLGFQSLHSSDLFQKNSYGYSYLPQISLPIFHFGALWGNVKLQEALKEEQKIAYEQALLSAAGQIRDALLALEAEQERNFSAREAYFQMREASDLTRNMYENGLVEYTDVLNAEERRLSAQEQMITSNGALYENIVTFYKAIGGEESFLKKKEITLMEEESF